MISELHMTGAIEQDVTLIAWLDRFAAAVRGRDLAAGKKLFADDVVAFGTIGVLLHGRDQLMTRQWSRVWPVTSGFRFDLDRAMCGSAGELAWAAAQWSSTAQRDSTPYLRHGRASFVFRRERGLWAAIHSHFSLDPDVKDAP